MAQLLLHGTLDVTVYEADSLVDPRRLSAGAPKLLRRVGTLCRKSLQYAVQLIGGVENRVGIGKDWGRLYATIDLERARVGRTRILQQEPENPRWNESFHIYCAHQAASVVVSVKNDNAVGATLLGRAKVPVANLLAGQEVHRWFALYADDGRAVKGGGRVRLRLRYDSNWAGRPLSPAFPGVPYTFFKQAKGCRVTLYQDAHAGNGFAPRIALSGGRLYRVHRCWEDVFDAICAARHLVYITGWSVYTEISLVRDPERPRPGGGQTLGELLRRRAEEGVRVLLLVWDDRTSPGGPLTRPGLMATHDEETFKYFSGTKVRCVLCPRNPDEGKSAVQGAETAAMFTHHQKTVVLDAPGGDRGGRRIVGFLGGIDLCDGRYDAQAHPLFATLDSVHRNDFHQPNFPGASAERGGPREPWHDVHSKLEGPVAWDVLSNFEQRWRKQAGADDLLLPLAGTAVAPRSAAAAAATSESDPQTWNVQLFRSIDGGAVAGFPETPEGAAAAGLVSGKDSVVDRSVQDAYIHAIRRARNFVYVENQYFLGSSFAWRPETGVDLAEIGALHVIPRELSLKIASKIEAGERFCVYVVVPMWPEGAPESASVQAILDWQRRTMQMMYDDVAQALRARQMFDVSPRDYLSFFCLGNRETKKPDERPPAQQPEPDTNYRRAQENRRFMIYVHAKTMIVDDEYIIVGSANINQRSMDGARDSEIAMGAYQPYQLGSSRGEIHGFRMSLWYEHTGISAPAFLEPQTLECTRYLNRIGQQNWEAYAGERVQDLPGHLMNYPLLVTNDGTVSEIPSFRNFPDTKAPVLGASSDYLPPILTT